MKHVLIYGPPGSGKSTLAADLSREINRPFIDLDAEIEKKAGATIPDIFQLHGETVFREMESDLLKKCLSSNTETIISLGGGALLDPGSRKMAEKNGEILCLSASLDILTKRLQMQIGSRPLLHGDLQQKIRQLIDQRQEHYASFENIIDTSSLSPEEVLWQAQVNLGVFHISGMGTGSDLRIRSGNLAYLGTMLKDADLYGNILIVSDENVFPLYGQIAQNSLEAAGYRVSTLVIPSGENFKSINSIQKIWDSCLKEKLERQSTIVALGGGVIGDLTGFAAATYLRGVPWVNVPTTLLSMVDSSLGGKTGINLPQGKNLAGAFHAPRLIVADPSVLKTLPEREWSSGLGETVKHAVISDPDLFLQCMNGRDFIKQKTTDVIRRSAAVKIRVIEKDPFEHGLRQSLNFGHTFGHGIEIASDFKLAHGEAIAIGMMLESRFSEHLNIAGHGLAEELENCLVRLGLPAVVPIDLNHDKLYLAINHDKKRANHKIRFALPVRIGNVKVGIVAEDWKKMAEFSIKQGGVMMHKLLVLNGPNLNLLGEREQGIYGEQTLESINNKIKDAANKLSIDVTFQQSNHEGGLIDFLHDARNWADGVVLNAGGYTHTSVALRDAVAAIHIPVVEVHMSNIASREEFRHTSLIAPVCVGSISGFGYQSYLLGMQALYYIFVS